MKTKQINKTYRYQDLNGSIACYDHIGCYAQGYINEYPNIERFSTTMTSWERMTEAEIAEFADFIKTLGAKVKNNVAEGEVCERCLFGN